MTTGQPRRMIVRRIGDRWCVFDAAAGLALGRFESESDAVSHASRLLAATGGEVVTLPRDGPRRRWEVPRP